MADPEFEFQGPPPLSPEETKKRFVLAELKRRVEDPRAALSVRRQWAEILDRNGVEFDMPAEQVPPLNATDYTWQGPKQAQPGRYVHRNEDGTEVAGVGEYHWEPQRGEHEGEEEHRRRSELAWNEAVGKAAKEQRSITRTRDMEPGVEYAAALGRAHVGGALYNLSRSATGGIADRAVGLIPGMGEARDAAEQYGQPGIVSNAISGRDPNAPAVPGLEFTNTAAALYGSLLPSSIMGRVAAGVTRATGAAEPAAKLVANVIGGALGGAATQGVELATDAAANEVEELYGRTPQTPTPTWQEARDRLLMSTAAGGALGVPSYAAQQLGKAYTRTTRRNRHDIVDLEAAGGGTDTIRGMRPPPAVDAAENLAARGPRTAGEPVTLPGRPATATEPAVPPRDIPDRSLLGVPAEDITAQRAARKGARALSRYRAERRAQIGDEVDRYATSPEGQAINPVDDAWNVANETLRTARDAEGRPLPLATMRVYQQHLAALSRGELIRAGTAQPGDVVISVRDARRFGVLTNEQGMDISRQAAEATDAMPYQRLNPGERALAGERRIETARIDPLAPESTVATERGRQVLPMRTLIDDAQRDLEARGLEVRLTPRAMNFREMERTIRNFQDQVENLQGNSRSAQAEDRILGAMYAMRENFGANDIAPQGARVMREGHARDMRELEDTLGALGLPRRMDRVDPNDQQVIRAMLNAARQWREGGADGPVIRERLERLMASDPEYEAAMRNVAAHHAYKRLSATEDIRGGSNRDVILTILSAIAQRADPAARWLSGETVEPPRTPPLGTALSERQGVVRRMAERTGHIIPGRPEQFDARGRGVAAARAARAAPQATEQEEKRKKKPATRVSGER